MFVDCYIKNLSQLSRKVGIIVFKACVLPKAQVITEKESVLLPTVEVATNVCSSKKNNHSVYQIKVFVPIQRSPGQEEALTGWPLSGNCY